MRKMALNPEPVSNYIAHYLLPSEQEALGLMIKSGRFAMSTGTDGDRGTAEKAADYILELAERINNERYETRGKCDRYL